MGSDGEGWQYIPPKGRKGRARLAKILQDEAYSHDSNTSTQPATSFLDVASITADHEKLCSRWKASPSYRDLRAIIFDNAAGHTAIKTAICLGLGSFDVKDEASRYCRSSHDAHVQLEAFRTVVEVLEEKSGQKIKCYAQEPSFGPSDQEFCRSLGIEVLEDPEAFQHVRSDALVCGFHLPHVAWGYALRDHLPGLYIGTDLKTLERLIATLQDGDDVESVTALNARIVEMSSLADRYVFPAGELKTLLDYTFYYTEILWMRGNEDGTAGNEVEGIADGIVNGRADDDSEGRGD